MNIPSVPPRRNLPRSHARLLIENFGEQSTCTANDVTLDGTLRLTRLSAPDTLPRPRSLLAWRVSIPSYQSELDNMQAACAKVSTVSDFLDEAAQRVSTLESGLERGELERRENEERTQEALRDVKADLANRADK